LCSPFLQYTKERNKRRLTKVQTVFMIPVRG
jgi:hypothetical protein